MVRGPKKHLKRLNAPKHWMLDKLGGIFAPKPSAGPHKTRECLPLILLVRNRLKYALTGREVTAILQNRHVLVDGKVRTDRTYPVGFMDVVSIPATEERFRVIYDAKGRFAVHRISAEEAAYKLVKVVRQQIGKGGVPFVVTHDGRTIRYPDPAVRVGDTLVLDIATGKPTDHVRHDVGALVMVTGGHNNGRVGTIVHKEKHRGSFDVVRVRDAAGHEFATRATNIFVVGKDDKPLVSLPKGKGIRESILQEQARVYGKGAEAH